MTVRTKRRLLVLLAGLLLTCSGGVVWLPFSSWWHVVAPRIDVTAVAEKRSAPAKDSHSTSRELTAQDFESFWKRPLRRALYDPPPPPPPPPKVVEVPPPRPITAKLIATMVETGNSMAMLQLSTGEIVFRKQDELIGAADADAMISNIEEGTISIKRGEETTKLMVIKR